MLGHAPISSLPIAAQSLAAGDPGEPSYIAAGQVIVSGPGAGDVDLSGAAKGHVTISGPVAGGCTVAGAAIGGVSQSGPAAGDTHCGPDTGSIAQSGAAAGQTSLAEIHGSILVPGVVAGGLATPGPKAGQVHFTPNRQEGAVMPSAIQITGKVFAGYSATLLARVIRGNAPIEVADIASAKYNIYLLDATTGLPGQTAITGHADVDVDPEDLLVDELVDDVEWTVDKTGRNFRYVIDVTTNQAFELPNRSYRVQFELTPVSGQVIPVRFTVTTM